MRIKALLVDDEPHAIAAAKHLIDKFPQVDLVCCAVNGVQAVKAVHELRPDVMFLDVQMPKLDGFEVLDLLGDEAPLVVFVTAYNEFAVKAFESDALDYLLKPLSEDRLAKSIDRIIERLTQSHELKAQALPQKLHGVITAHQQAQAPLQRILVREKGDVYVIPVNEIYAIESADDYVVIHTFDRNYIKQDRLNNIESLLNAQQFCRIHRSSIINLDFLIGIETEGKDSRFANIKNGQKFSISRSGYGRLIKLL